MATKSKRNRKPKQQRSLRRLWVHDSGNFYILHINNGVEGFDYFVTDIGNMRYRLTKLVPGDMKVYMVNINLHSMRYGCQCESFKQIAKEIHWNPEDFDTQPPTCKHIDALLKDRSV